MEKEWKNSFAVGLRSGASVPVPTASCKRNGVEVRLVWFVCILALTVAFTPHHHHGETSRACFNFFHCLTEGGHAHAAAHGSEGYGHCVQRLISVTGTDSERARTVCSTTVRTVPAACAPATVEPVRHARYAGEPAGVVFSAAYVRYLSRVVSPRAPSSI